MRDGSIAGCQCLDRVFHKDTEDWGTHLAEVFESLRPAHTEPTDDEREALAEVLHYAQGFDDWGVANDEEREGALDIADAVLAAGFRHPAQTEPTDAQVHSAAVAIDPAAWEPGIFYWEASGARDNSLELARAALKAAFTTGQEEQS